MRRRADAYDVILGEEALAAAPAPAPNMAAAVNPNNSFFIVFPPY